MANELRNFLQLSYEELEELNLHAKEQRKKRVAPDTDSGRAPQVPDRREADQGRHGAVQRPGRPPAHARLRQEVSGQELGQPDVRRLVDPRLHRAAGERSAAGHGLERVLLGAGGLFRRRQGDGFRRSDRQGRHAVYGRHARHVEGLCRRVHDKHGYTLNAANEIEGFLFKGIDAEQHYHETGKFEYVNTGGYYHSLPGDPLRTFIDTVAEVQRAMGFQNEKDHPEVAPSQFEINYGYAEVVAAADQIQLYKLICRQVATKMGLTARFLPKPVVGVNGSGMHTNVSVTKGGKNIFWDPKGEEKMSKFAWEFVDRILTHGNDICLLLNPSVNAYRRLDPHFEAPNQIKASATDRGSMVRIPIGNERSARVEVRSVAPDANPYMVLLSVFKTGLDGETSKIKNLRQAERYLPDNIYDAIKNFEAAEWTTTLFGDDVKGRYADLKRGSADRCPRLLGTFVKSPEVQYHHEVYNQFLWNMF